MAVLSACGSGSGASTNTTNNTTSQQQPITVGLSPNSAQMVDQGQTKQFTATVTNDSSNKGVNWTLTQNGLVCSPGCGTVSPANTASATATTYTAPAAVAANIQFNVVATSAADTTKSASAQTTVVSPPAPNNPQTLPPTTAGQAYMYTLTVSGGIGPYTWSLTSGSLPPGLSLNSNTGVISGTLPVAEHAGARIQRLILPPVDFPFTVEVVDSGNPPLTAQQPLHIMANVTPVAITTTSLPNGVVGTAYSQTLAATGGLSPYVWMVASGSLPAGLTLSSSGVLSGTPTASGTFGFVVQAADSAPDTQTVQQNLSLTINPTPSFSLSASPNSLNIVQGTSGTSTITVNPMNGFTGNVTLAASGLPSGVSPSFNPSSATTSTLTLTASATAVLGSASVTVTGTTNNLVPQTTSISLVIFGSNPNGFAFGRTFLPDGKIGTAYNQGLSPVHGTGVVTITLVSGTLPPGLSLSQFGAIVGTPQGPNGTSNFTLQATDSSVPPQVVQQNFSISITDMGSCVFDASGFGPPNTNPNLKGTYVYRFQGFDANGNAVARVGQFTADGSQDRAVDQAFGHITGVIQDSATSGGGMPDLAKGLPDSTYCIGGNSATSEITLGAVHYRIGVMGIGNLGGVDDGISFIEFDATDNVRGSGVMRLQKATTITQTGNVTYVFGMSGTDNSQNTNLPTAVVGQFTIDPMLSPVAGLSGLKGEENVSDAAIRGNLGPGFYRTMSASLNASMDSNGNPIPGRYTGQIAADPATTPGDIGSGSIDFVAYAFKAANAAPTTANPTELFVMSTGTPAATVLSGEIVSQNFATNSTFNNSATPNTPDARALGNANFYITGGLVDPPPSTVAYGDATTKSVAEIGFVSFDGSRKPAASAGNVVQLESDTDIAGSVQGPSQLPAPATYQVKPDGAVTFAGGGELLPEIVLYLSDVNTGFAIVDDPGFLLAGFGRVLPSRNPGAGIVPVLGELPIGDLPTQVPGSATTVGVINASSLNGGPGAKIVQDVDDQSAGLVSGSQLGIFPITATDSFGRFTIGTCPAPPQNVVAPCFVGYYQFLNGDGDGALVLDETTADFDSVTQTPSLRVWGVIP